MIDGKTSLSDWIFIIGVLFFIPIVIIAIILVVAAIFREQLTAAVTTVFENLTDFIG